MRWKLIAAAAVLAALVQAQVRLGAPAPDLGLRSASDRPTHDFHGKKVVVILAEAMPEGMNAVVEELRQLGVEVVPAAPRSERPSVWLLDEAGIVRAVEPLPASARSIVKLVKDWELGKASFESGCPLCHDPSGQEVYPGAKPLEGVGNRLSREQIRTKLNATMISPSRYSIRCLQFTERELEALVMYVAGL